MSDIRKIIIVSTLYRRFIINRDYYEESVFMVVDNRQ